MLEEQFTGSQVFQPHPYVSQMTQLLRIGKIVSSNTELIMIALPNKEIEK